MNARKIQIRTKKSDSAYVYHLLEAHEGLTAYSTLPHNRGEQERGMELIFAPEAEKDVLSLIAELQKMMWVEVVSKK
jgi:hypothetical protein